MKKYCLTLLGVLCCLSLTAATNKDLAFYQQQSELQAKTTKLDRAVANAMAQELSRWIQAHPQDKELKDALLLQAQYALRAGKKAEALLRWYQVRFYFPGADEIAFLSLQVESTMQSLNRGKTAQALQLLTYDTSALSSMQQRIEALLGKLVLSDLTDLYQPVTALFTDYLTQYPNSAQADKMTLLLGDWHRQNKNYYAAIMQYKKVYDLYPKTPYKAAALRMMADVYAGDLKEYETATSLYDHVLKQYPQSTEVGVVYKHLAVMEENRKNYADALTYYDKALADLGNQPASYEAWIGKADVLQKTREYQAAYDCLLQGAAVFSSDEGKYTYLLMEAAKVAQKRLRNPALETAALEKILLAYPQTQYAPELMYQLGSAYEKQGKTAQALETYKRLIIQYPTDKWSSRAQSRLTRLEKQAE